MSGYIPDNYDHFLVHDGRLAYIDKHRPECGWCGQKIYTDYAYQVEGDMVCTRCMDRWLFDHQVDIEEE